MTTATETWELAMKLEDGSWEHVGDYPTRHDAEQAAAAHGDGDYGLSSDPRSGRYELALSVCMGAIFVPLDYPR